MSEDCQLWVTAVLVCCVRAVVEAEEVRPSALHSLYSEQGTSVDVLGLLLMNELPDSAVLGVKVSWYQW